MNALLALGIVMLIGCAYLLAEVATLPARQRRAAIGRATRYADDEVGTQTAPEFRERALAPLFGELNRVVERVIPAAALESIEQRLLAAGLAWRISPAVFLAGKVVAACVGVMLGVFAGTSSGNAFRAFLFALAFGAAFFLLPDRLLAGRTRARKEILAGDLPDALDLLAISVEAGLSLDGAIGQLVEHMEGPLADELVQTLGEIRVGETRQDALRRLSDRVNVPAMTALTRAIIQSDQLGMPLGRIMRLQARDVRIQRQAAAEERANKMPVKMLLPTAIFIFPALFIVVLGPALIELFKVL